MPPALINVEKEKKKKGFELPDLKGASEAEAGKKKEIP